jgi:hypothetical protein
MFFLSFPFIKTVVFIVYWITRVFYLLGFPSDNSRYFLSVINIPETDVSKICFSCDSSILGLSIFYTSFIIYFLFLGFRVAPLMDGTVDYWLL